MGGAAYSPALVSLSVAQRNGALRLGDYFGGVVNGAAPIVSAAWPVPFGSVARSGAGKPSNGSPFIGVAEPAGAPVP